KRMAERNRINANIANALKLCQANVMLADQDMNIIYTNDSLLQMLGRREQQIQQALPSFRISTLVGTNVDVFHKHPAHQRSLMANLKEPYKTQLNVAGLTFSLTATPWQDTDGKRIGTVVEWLDLT